MLRINLLPLIAILAAAFVSAAASADTYLPPRAPLMPGLTKRRHATRHLDARSSTFFKRQEEQKSVEEVDLEEWQRTTAEKCMNNLKSIAKASNPAGVAVCYNIPFLDKTNGVFAADLRMYQISPREGDWLEAGEIFIQLAYPNAAVQPMDFNTTKEATPPGGPQILQQFNFLGTIKAEFVSAGLTQEELRQRLMPNVSLTADTKSGTMLAVQLATNEAFFVNGVFQELRDNNMALAAALEPVPFKLPGTAIEIMPIGMIIYSIYMFFGVAIVMYGTFERRKFRDQFRQRIAQQGPVNTI